MYDDCYGGAYIDDNGELVVLLTDNSFKNRSKMKEYTGNSTLQTEFCQYSYNELKAVINTINEHWEYLQEQGATLSSMYSDIMSNCVVINVRELDDYKESLIRNVIDTEFMVIQNTDEVIEQQSGTGTPMKAGYALYNTATGKHATLGFCAMRNGKKGYVTASHFAKKVGQEISYNGTVIGTVTQTGYHSNSTADAAFIESNGVAELTNIVLGDYYCISASTAEFPRGARIYMYGIASGLREGILYYYDYTYEPKDGNGPVVEEHAAAQYTSAPKDSGGPVFVYTGTVNGKHTCCIIGIHTASTFHTYDEANSVFCPYSNIVNKFNITAITE